MRYGRFRKKRSGGGFLPVLIPVMNLFLLILPIVIQSAFIQKLTTVEMQLPSISESSAGEAQKTAQIVLDVRQESVAVYVDDAPKSELRFAPGFESQLAGVLEDLKKQHPRKKDIVMKVSPMTRYELVVGVMDECKKGGNLFPDIVYLDEVK